MKKKTLENRIAQLEKLIKNEASSKELDSYYGEISRMFDGLGGLRHDQQIEDNIMSKYNEFERAIRTLHMLQNGQLDDVELERRLSRIDGKPSDAGRNLMGALQEYKDYLDNIIHKVHKATANMKLVEYEINLFRD